MHMGGEVKNQNFQLQIHWCLDNALYFLENLTHFKSILMHGCYHGKNISSDLSPVLKSFMK